MTNHRIECNCDDFLYYYKADLVRIVDGDTVVVNIDLGFGNWLRGQYIRLHGVDAVERSHDLHPEILTKLDYFLGDAGQLYLRSYKDKKGKYGRWLGDLNRSDGRCWSQFIIDSGYAKASEGYAKASEGYAKAKEPDDK